MVPCRVYSESVSNFSFDTLGDDSEAGRAERYRAPRGMGGAREGWAKGEKRGMGAAPPSRLDIYSFLFAARLKRSCAVEENPGGDVLFPKKETQRTLP